MSEALQAIGNFFQGPTGKAVSSIGSLGATGAGLVGNLLNEKARSDAANMAKRNALLSPAQIAQQVNQATQPLDQNLVRAITGRVNADMAAQGLSQAPGLLAQNLGIALAGPEQIQQQKALEIVMARLGLPKEYASLIPQNSQLAPGIAMLMKQLGSLPTPTSTSTPTPPLYAMNPNLAQLGQPDVSADTTPTYTSGDLIPPAYGGMTNFGGG